MTSSCAPPIPTITASDIFEVGSTGESFLDTWPLKELIAKQITPAWWPTSPPQHRAGRRLFVTTTNLDADRFVVWNMGAIAAARRRQRDQAVPQRPAGIEQHPGRLSRRS